MSKITVDFLRRRLERLVCPVMGWNYGPAYSAGPTGAIPNHGAVWIEQAPNAKYWRVCQMLEDSTGERNLSDNYTKDELLAWMDGILKATDLRAQSETTLGKLSRISRELSQTSGVDLLHVMTALNAAIVTLR